MHTFVSLTMHHCDAFKQNEAELEKYITIWVIMLNDTFSGLYFVGKPH